ncbi:VOC family protein [Pseudooceanicola sp. CBS1P-1]|uniref:VOC family protein n=1 Tax=Pseudooceanicola albus TaxID=2692189 RepID=A0A6L7FZ65_9RHOB|nr:MULTISPECIES: VOC family protein [Pseudooceanicola]MBT9384022.1 VOC family protein [Pseudooceanicola endophyticus]MXN16566.1 VOC family protein [Pseudooceanicola albus]
MISKSVIWTEIPVRHLETAIDFYNAVFHWNTSPMMMGPDRVAPFGQGGVGGDLVEGPVGNGTGNVIHLMVPDALEAALARAEAAGARIDGPVIEIPPGRYRMIRDPDGNRIGLFEPKAA